MCCSFSASKPKGWICPMEPAKIKSACSRSWSRRSFISAGHHSGSGWSVKRSATETPNSLAIFDRVSMLDLQIPFGPHVRAVMIVWIESPVRSQRARTVKPLAFIRSETRLFMCLHSFCSNLSERAWPVSSKNLEQNYPKRIKPKPGDTTHEKNHRRQAVRHGHGGKPGRAGRVFRWGNRGRIADWKSGAKKTVKPKHARFTRIHPHTPA